MSESTGGAPRRANGRSLLGVLLPEAAGVHMQRLGRTLAQAGLVGALAGLIGTGFCVGLDFVQHLLLEDWAGARLLRASGEAASAAGTTSFRPWLLVLLPAAGGLLAGLIMRLAPETRGGGGDAMIHAFHHGSSTRPRHIVWVKALASILTLGSGGAGGREGPTMQIGGAIGEGAGRWLGLSLREQRMLLVSGVAAGLTAVFRTPLGAALLAVEVLYRDDFETEALVPALLASVVSYAVVVVLRGEATLFGLPAGGFPFEPVRLPLYALLAVLVAALATVFQSTLKRVRAGTARLPIPEWTRPAIGGLLVGALAVPLILLTGTRTGQPGQALGILGGGYGAAQLAIGGGSLVPAGWDGVLLLLLLCGVKLLAASFTIGTGGSAGDFAPSLVLGALLGGAFGRAAQIVLGDPTLPVGAFALVGMATFYGGIAHVPVSALVMICELAGRYDLLVPLMLAGGVAFVALRHRTLYEAQVPTRADSPVHRRERGMALLAGVLVRDIFRSGGGWLQLAPATPAAELLRRLPQATGQDAFPVVDERGRLTGLISSEAVRTLASLPTAHAVVVAADLADPPLAAHLDDTLQAAAATMLARGLRELPVIDADGALLGLLRDADVFRAWIAAAEAAPAPS